MAAVPNSILDTVKKAVGVDPENDQFDVDILMHINSVFATLNQLGVGPIDGFEIEDNSTLWVDYLGGNKLINSVKSMMVLQVQLYFDTATMTSFNMTAKQAQIDQIQWRLNVVVDTPIILADGTNGNSAAFMWTLEADNVWPQDAEEGDLGIYPGTGLVWRKH